MSGYNGRKAVDPEVVMAEVVETKRVSPHMMRVTLGGEGIGRLTVQGYDQWFRLFMTRHGQDNLKLPTASSGWWYAQYLATPRSRRPHVRNYTIRAARTELNEIDVDFVVHEDADGSTGPGAGFATGCRAGERVGILDQGVGYNPRHEHDWVLLAADESGLPAVAGICESLPDGKGGLAVVEVPTAADKQDFKAPPGMEVRWVVRDELPGAADDGAGHDVVPGAAALEAVRAADLPDGEGYAFAIGESGLATGARRHLVNERGVPKAHVDFVGYWKHGRASS
ncbi:siderophore-interacting protein [Myceligenerans pegani]|uniref:Siderophore-interacting protein n=1 Tax=Myceligenerans pegani TaxID=2776917 RepID=A0ABR9N3Y4_9MICO|nr:siderophore-interacting protein [Myceligenerans sp. TRM 65318]MBE1877717.1 siderophore-interacting protein [Myceligenerans sp. TRM 65318]MBE3019988.1 siderophore-interacting protein [Myceligenerans sp. TRM 65318]